MRPNRLVLPAPFGPTIPTRSPGSIASDRSSAMTTAPNLFLTCSSSSSGLVLWLLVGRQQVGGDLRVRLQGVVDDLHLQRVLGSLLPLHADRRGDRDAGSGPAGCEVERSGRRLDVHLVNRRGEFVLVVRVANGLQGGVGDLEEAVVADVGVPPTPLRARLEFVRELLASLASE